MINQAIFSNNLINTFFASALIWFMFLGLVALYLFGTLKKKEIPIHSYLSFFLAWFFGDLVKGLIPSVRPYQITGAPPLTFSYPTDSSFPSTHAAAVFALATTVWLHDKKLGTVYFIGAILVSYGRVVTNVHYPIDVAAGAILGIFVALVVNNLHIKLASRKTG